MSSLYLTWRLRGRALTNLGHGLGLQHCRYYLDIPEEVFHDVWIVDVQMFKCHIQSCLGSCLAIKGSLGLGLLLVFVFNPCTIKVVVYIHI